jgi:hypothetical protein
MVPTALLALALLLGGGAFQTGALLNAVSAVWGAAGLEAGKHAGPDGTAKAGNILDPDGASAPSDAGNGLDPDGLAASAPAPNDAGNILDPNG